MSSYKGYDLADMPRGALPQTARSHKGKHSYTVYQGNAKIEVLLRAKAFIVKSGKDHQQITWSKHNGAENAWVVACGRAGILPFPKRQPLRR